MNIIKFVTSLLPSFGREQVLEDCRITRSELLEGTLPAYAAATEMFKGWKLKNKDLQKKAGQYQRMTHTSTTKGKSLVGDIYEGLKQCTENLKIVEEMIQRTYQNDIASSGLTYQKAQLLQFVEHAGFASKYARKFLIQIYVLESAEFKGADIDLNKTITPAEQKWLEENYLSFCTAMNVVGHDPARLRKAITEIPDIVVTEDNAATLRHTVGDAKLDPLNFRLVPLAINPIYHIRMAVAEWQANRYKAAHEEVKLLQLRRLNLQRLAAGQPDARLQQEIAYLEGRIANLNYKLEEMEKSYG